MDISALLSTFMSANSTEGISRATGVSNDQTRSILSSALPMLLGGALSQSTGSSTASGFAGALTQHALDNTSDVGAFMSGVDMKDGEKIVNHLLGSNSDAVVAQIAGNSGVKKADVKKVLAAAAPLLMSLLGKEVNAQQQTQPNNAAGVGGIMSALLGGGGSGTASLLTGLLGGGAQQQQPQQQNNSSGGLASLLMGLLK
ncbi:MAG: DUF937 domain-containing protein [Oscillospiraceae bacterium]|nr:DUF937 domain-containing protein [Oscillospiraceae bacterium]